MAHSELLAQDETYMARALALARNGVGWVDPNPLVGAVVVKDGRVIAEGWHARFGGPHAEREAFAHATDTLQGSTLYVTLEPCCHQGKTPPCSDAIIAAGIRRVVIGVRDPNPLVSGQGIAALVKAGISVTEGVLQDECKHLNRIFFQYVSTGLPYVVAKYAMTLDGKMATAQGYSKWITGEQARAHVHTQRHRFAAIMVGIATVLKDDPLLTCRMEDAHRFGLVEAVASPWQSASSLQLSRDPIRVVVDSTLRIPLDAQVIATARQVPTLVATLSSDKARVAELHKRGCEVLYCQERQGRIDLQDLMEQLGARNVSSVYVEGGPTLHASLFKAGLVQEVHAYVAPKIFGGTEAISPVGGTGVSLPQDAQQAALMQVRRIGADLLLECEVC